MVWDGTNRQCKGASFSLLPIAARVGKSKNDWSCLFDGLVIILDPLRVVVVIRVAITRASQANGSVALGNVNAWQICYATTIFGE